MKIYLEYKDKRLHKFWDIEQEGETHTVHYRKIGSSVRVTSKTFDSEEALKDTKRQMKAKKKKVYAETTPPKPSKNKQKVVKIREPLEENSLFDFRNYEKVLPQGELSLIKKTIKNTIQQARTVMHPKVALFTTAPAFKLGAMQTACAIILAANLIIPP